MAVAYKNQTRRGKPASIIDLKTASPAAVTRPYVEKTAGDQIRGADLEARQPTDTRIS